MAKMKIALYNDDGKRNFLSVEEVTEETANLLANRFFDAAGSERAEKETISLEEEAPTFHLDSSEKPEEEHSSIEEFEVKDEEEDFELPEDDIPETTMADAFSKALKTTKEKQPVEKENKKTESENDDIPEYFRTGIKEKDGLDHYKCHYWCKNPACQEDGSNRSQGNRYILPDQEYIHCHECNAALMVTDATLDGFPERDDFGNYFIADELAPSELFVDEEE